VHRIKVAFVNRRIYIKIRLCYKKWRPCQTDWYRYTRKAMMLCNVSNVVEEWTLYNSRALECWLVKVNEAHWPHRRVEKKFKPKPQRSQSPTIAHRSVGTQPSGALCLFTRLCRVVVVEVVAQPDRFGSRIDSLLQPSQTVLYAIEEEENRKTHCT
jgi:hypothetical protein